MQAISKDDTLQRYSKDYFDVIIIYETHQSLANSYKNARDYFGTKLWLSIPTTCDKRDNNIDGANIYEIFDYQIVYEI